MNTASQIFFVTFVWIHFFYHFLVPVSWERLAVGQLGSATGMVVSVPPNPDNTLAAQFAQKQSELESRERILSQREEAMSMTVLQEQYLQMIILVLCCLFIAHLMADRMGSSQKSSF